MLKKLTHIKYKYLSFMVFREWMLKVIYKFYGRFYSMSDEFMIIGL